MGWISRATGRSRLGRQWRQALLQGHHSHRSFGRGHWPPPISYCAGLAAAPRHHGRRPHRRARWLPCFGNDSSLPLGKVRLLAYFIAEGGLTSTTPGFTNTDPEIVADFKALIARDFQSLHVRQHAITYFPSGPRGGKPNPLTDWLRDLDLMGKPATKKRFPDCVWRWDRDRLREFIRVLMSCDGTVYSMGGYPRIEFAVASEGLAQDMHHALVRFGIVAKLWKKKDRCWRVEITEPVSVRRYQTQIGWI